VYVNVHDMYLGAVLRKFRGLKLCIITYECRTPPDISLQPTKNRPVQPIHRLQHLETGVIARLR
jgi:hypothetical protein